MIHRPLAKASRGSPDLERMWILKEGHQTFQSSSLLGITNQCPARTVCPVSSYPYAAYTGDMCTRKCGLGLRSTIELVRAIMDTTGKSIRPMLDIRRVEPQQRSRPPRNIIRPVHGSGAAGRSHPKTPNSIPFSHCLVDSLQSICYGR